MSFLAIPRAELADLRWNEFVSRHDAGWFWHRSEWIDYVLAYTPGSEDLSFAVVDDAYGDFAVRAVVPLVQEGETISMGGIPCICPLGAGSPDGQDLMALLHYQSDACLQTLMFHGVRLMTQRAMPLPLRTPAWPPRKWIDRSWQTFVVDLAASSKTLWRDVRKSYHALINKRRADVIVTTDATHTLGMATAQELHRREAGHETRSFETWAMMTRWLHDGYAVLALILPPGTPATQVEAATGYAYALAWQHWAYYASGATLDKNTAHALQWRLLLALRSRGILHYELGWDVRPGEEADRKAVGIATFKGGFGGTRWVVHAADCPVPVTDLGPPMSAVGDGSVQ
jgi:hypothetical protein